VPARFTFRFDRRLTAGETPERALHDVETLESVARARASPMITGCTFLRSFITPPSMPLTRSMSLHTDPFFPKWDPCRHAPSLHTTSFRLSVPSRGQARLITDRMDGGIPTREDSSGWVVSILRRLDPSHSQI